MKAIELYLNELFGYGKKKEPTPEFKQKLAASRKKYPIEGYKYGDEIEKMNFDRNYTIINKWIKNKDDLKKQLRSKLLKELKSLEKTWFEDGISKRDLNGGISYNTADLQSKDKGELRGEIYVETLERTGHGIYFYVYVYSNGRFSISHLEMEG